MITFASGLMAAQAETPHTPECGGQIVYNCTHTHFDEDTGEPTYYHCIVYNDGTQDHVIDGEINGRPVKTACNHGLPI